MELSIIIPTFNEGKNITNLLDAINKACVSLDCQFEIIVVDGGSKDDTFQKAQSKGARVFIQEQPGYGGAFRDALNRAQGKYIITLDADSSHNPYLIKRLFLSRNSAQIIIASRYIRGGLAQMSLSRYILSVIINRFFSFGLSLPFRDVTSGFRLYNAAIFKEIDFFGRDFSILPEILVKAYINGFSVQEIPLHYLPRSKGRSNARIIEFGLGFLRTFFQLWKIRNSINSVDYDERAFYSRIPMQRFWQRQRYKIISNLAANVSSVLDIGCGSSLLLGTLPQTVGLDINFKKLRYSLIWGNSFVNADIKHLCFKNSSFQAIICSEVIEHVDYDQRIFEEFKRVLRPGGTLILGTPDYSRLSWRLIEWLYMRLMPGGYAKEHITQYTRRGLIELLKRYGFELDTCKYILGSELICRFRKINQQVKNGN